MQNNLTAFALRNPARIQHGYPAHDPPLAHSHPPEAVINIQISNNSDGQEANPHRGTALDQSTTIGDEEEVLPDDDPSILGINGQLTTRLNTPKVAPYVLTMVLSLLGVVSINLKHGKHTHLHIANPFMLSSVVAFGIAYVTFSVLSWVYDRSDYKMLKGLYYIGCNLAFISLLLMLFTTT